MIKRDKTKVTISSRQMLRYHCLDNTNKAKITCNDKSVKRFKENNLLIKLLNGAVNV